MFDATKTIGKNAILQHQMKDIKNEFGIDWGTVEWTDLTKPLYSAIAARFYLQLQAPNIAIPRDIPNQAEFWTKYYRTSGTRKEFEDEANTLETGRNQLSKINVYISILCESQ